MKQLVTEVPIVFLCYQILFASHLKLFPLDQKQTYFSLSCPTQNNLFIIFDIYFEFQHTILLSGGVIALLIQNHNVKIATSIFDIRSEAYIYSTVPLMTIFPHFMLLIYRIINKLFFPNELIKLFIFCYLLNNLFKHLIAPIWKKKWFALILHITAPAKINYFYLPMASPPLSLQKVYVHNFYIWKE